MIPSTGLPYALASTLPEGSHDGYVAAAYIVFFVLVLVYVAIMAYRLTRVERAVRDLRASAGSGDGSQQDGLRAPEQDGLHVPERDGLPERERSRSGSSEQSPRQQAHTLTGTGEGL